MTIHPPAVPGSSPMRQHRKTRTLLVAKRGEISIRAMRAARGDGVIAEVVAHPGQPVGAKDLRVVLAPRRGLTAIP